jgi:wyosine [tRNA(Phe)-imidazoG37] synthetase (radical SAM superfamily)
VDLVPPKTCTFDCLYCEVGPTTHLTRQRRAYGVGEIIRDLEVYFQHPPQALDYVTLAGSGEPTLNLGLKEIITAVQRLTSTPVAVLTNGALLHLPEVRQDLAGADVILPSLDAARKETFQRINRPHPGLTLDLVISGIKALRREFAGQIWLEVMLLKGLNDGEAELTALRRLIHEIAPDKVQLNTAVRPVADRAAQPLSREEMAAIATFFGAGTEIIAGVSRAAPEKGGVADTDFLEMLARRPMTAEDLARALGLSLPEVRKYLGRLSQAGLISRDLHRDRGFYRSLAPLAP